MLTVTVHQSQSEGHSETTGEGIAHPNESLLCTERTESLSLFFVTVLIHPQLRLETEAFLHHASLTACLPSFHGRSIIKSHLTRLPSNSDPARSSQAHRHWYQPCSQVSWHHVQHPLRSATIFSPPVRVIKCKSDHAAGSGRLLGPAQNDRVSIEASGTGWLSTTCLGVPSDLANLSASHPQTCCIPSCL